MTPAFRIPLFVCLGLALLATLWSRPSAAHDLAIDQLRLSVEPGSRILRGEIEFDPELGRSLDEPRSPAVERRVIRFLEQSLVLEVDGRALVPRLSLRELWVSGGAVRGDLVALEVALPPEAANLRIFAAPALKALVVSIRRASSDGTWTTHSTLALGGNWTEPYRLDGAALGAWRAGGADQFAADAGAADAGPLPAPARVLPTPESAWREAGRFLVLGVEHIVPRGFDHVLFVVGLVLAARRLKPLLLQLTAFTAAHSVTLALGALGWIVLPRGLVEPLIALSIAFVAIENLLRRGESRSRPAVVFLFGLLHGQGFAGVLSELGLPRGSFLVALISFNVGVELGQLFVTGLALLPLLGIKDPITLRKFAVVPGSALIAGMGLYWSVERLFG